jgi:hypothetical protein
LGQEDKDARHDLKVSREAHARILASRAHPAAPEGTGVSLPEPRPVPPGDADLPPPRQPSGDAAAQPAR